MIHRIGKKTFFFFGVIVASVTGFLGGVFRGHFSKSESLIAPVTDYESLSVIPWARADGPPVGGCFPAGSRVSTPVGDKPIESLVVGDLVYGFNVDTGERVVAPVVKTFQHTWDEVHDRSPLLVFKHESGVFTVTKNHWVYRVNDRNDEYANFDRAGLFEVGDVLVLEDGTTSVITKIEQGPEYDFVYNLTVEGVHTYFADGVRVHNRNGLFFIPTASADDDDGGGGGGGGADAGGAGGADAGGGAGGCGGGCGGSDSCDDIGGACGGVGGDK